MAKPRDKAAPATTASDPARELARLQAENAALRRRDAELTAYLRQKVDQLLQVIGTLPLQADELDDAGLIAFDPIGIIADSFTQILQTQKQINAELKLAHKKTDAIYNAVGAGIVVLDRERHILSCNQRLKELFFPGRRKVIGQTCVELMCQAETPPAGCVFAKVMASGVREQTNEWPFAGHCFDVVGMPLKDRRGNVQQVVIVYHEVTERIRAEQELNAALEQTRATSEHLETIVSSVNEGMLVTDCQGKLLVANPAAGRLLGVSQEKLVARHLAEICPGSTLAERMRQACASDEPGDPFDLRLDGGNQARGNLLQARLALLHTAEGGVRGGVITLRDVSYEREMERMKSEFVSTAAHELRTPLTAIIGFSELLLDPEAAGNFSAAERDEFIGMILNRAESLASLIDELLDISRIEAGRDIPLLRETVDLVPLAGTCVEFYRRSASEHRFVLELPPTPVLVFADPRRLTQVFENLLSNAVKYSPEGAVITVRLHETGQQCCITVSDTGIGMTAEQVRHVFDKFYRADATNTAIPGTGLGMTIVRKLVTSHGGDISVQSTPGQGTSVTVTLPLLAPA